jgi:hypothetical protein
MRRFDKKNNIIKANFLVEQRHLQSKGLISENVFDEVNDTPTGMNDFNTETNNENYSMESDNFNSDLEMSYYDIIKKIESKIEELRSDFNQNEDKIYKFETLINETQRLSNYLSEIK